MSLEAVRGVWLSCSKLSIVVWHLRFHAVYNFIGNFTMQHLYTELAILKTCPFSNKNRINNILLAPLFEETRTG
jgi:hypothetical protein